MRCLAFIIYPFRHLIRRIITYVQDTAGHELSWFLFGATPLELLDAAKDRANESPQHVATEILTFFLISAFLLVLIILSMKCLEDENDNAEEEQLAFFDRVISETVSEYSQNSIYLLVPRPIESKSYFLRHDCGDSPDVPAADQLLRYSCSYQQFFLIISGSEDPVSSIPSTASLGTEAASDSPERQQVQKCASRAQPRHVRRRLNLPGRAAERDWIVRRTRSGLVYGEYPL